MQIRVNTAKENIASTDLLKLSRSIRGLREETENIRRRVRCHSQLEGCRVHLREQEEALSLLTARLVTLSTALRQICDMYDRAEKKNLEHLEEECCRYRGAEDVLVTRIDDRFWKRIRQIVY